MMSPFNDRELHDLALEPARRLLGDGVEAVDIREGVGSIDEPAYFITYRLRDVATWSAASKLKTPLFSAISDALLERGDERYPFIRLLLPESWRQVFALEPG